MYKLTRVTKLYQKGRRTVPAVRDLNLTIADGEWLAVQGRTGHGKSTLLNLLGGLDRPTEGSIELDGICLGALRETQLTRVRPRRPPALGTVRRAAAARRDRPCPGQGAEGAAGR
jgi:putative ABC transport system ATP-binding protein